MRAHDWRRIAVVVLCIPVTSAISACSGGGVPAATPPSPIVTPARVRIPADGLTLSDLGLVNGPVTAFSVPRGVGIVVAVDQPNGVSLVLKNLPASAIADYLRRALPGAGFAITRDDPATSTLTFTGSGWHGSFTGAENSSAVILRP